MSKGIITFCYRKIIDNNSSKAWDKMVFEDTYAEFKLQAQYFNQAKKYQTFAELIRNVPGAERLHFLVNAAVLGYVQQLNGVIPDILNNLGRHFLKFSNYQFEIINSNINDLSRHQIAVNFFSEPLLWHDTVGDLLLVSEVVDAKSEVQTHLLRLQPFLSIHTLK